VTLYTQCSNAYSERLLDRFKKIYHNILNAIVHEKKREATDNKSWLTHTFRNAANIRFCVSFIVLWEDIKRNSAHSCMLDIKKLFATARLVDFML